MGLRIGRPPTTIVQGGGGPAFTDGYAIGITAADPTSTPTDAASIALKLPDVSSTPTDAAQIALTFADATSTPTDGASIRIIATDPTSTPTDAAQIALTYGDASSTPTDAAQIALTYADPTSTPTDARDTFLYYYVTAASDNDSSRTTPANAIGKQNGVFAKVTTNLQTADTTNPVTLTCTVGNIPTTGNFTSKKLYLWFTVAAGTANLDTLTIYVTTNLNTTNVYGTGSANSASAAAYGTTPLIFDLSSQTLANLSSVTVGVRYNAAVVLTPQTAIMFDAAAIVLEGGI